MKKSSASPFLKNTCLLSASVLCFLVAAEFVTRWMYPDAIQSYKNLPQGLLCQRDPVLGWIGISNVKGKWTFQETDMEDMNVVMNKEGFWDKMHVVEKPPDVNRILFLGDSFTSGYGIGRHQRFSAFVGRALTSEYEIINMGLWGYSTDQELLVLKEKGLKYNPDIVILSMFMDDFFNNNLYSVNDGIFVKPRFFMDKNGDLELRNSPTINNHSESLLFNMIITRLYKFRNRLAVGWEFDRIGWFSIFDREFVKQDGYSLTLRLLMEIRSITEQRDIHLLVVVIPLCDQLHEREIHLSNKGYGGIAPGRLDLRLPQKVVTLFCKKSNIPMLDLLPILKKHTGERIYFQNDLHWTKAGHRLAAESIVSHMRKENFL